MSQRLPNITEIQTVVKVLLNIRALYQCTNILFAEEVWDYEAKCFEHLNGKYDGNSIDIFKNLPIKPNHHYPLHIPDQIILWVPLSEVPKFSGERLIGGLYKIEKKWPSRCVVLVICLGIEFVIHCEIWWSISNWEHDDAVVFQMPESDSSLPSDWEDDWFLYEDDKEGSKSQRLVN